VLRASITAERAGVPSVSLVGTFFEPPARAAAEYLDMEAAPLALYPGHMITDDDESFRTKVRGPVVEQVIAGLTSVPAGATPRPVDPQPRDIVFSGTLDEVQEHFHDKSWSDGLPVIPPTLERVEAMLRHTDRDPDEILGVMLPEKREATVWNVAVNGVMAGCRPEYMPILLAVAECVCDPEFRIEDHGSTPGWEPLIVLSGPIAQQLDFNSGVGVMRVGRRPNTSVGRFLRMYTRNIAGLRIPPGDSDRAGIGNPFNVVLAEDEETVRDIGWPTFGDDRGAGPGESVVTVQSVVASSNPVGGFHGPANQVATFLEPLVEVFGKVVSGYWFFTAAGFGRWHPLIIISPAVARLMARDGWTKDDVRAHLFEHSLVPASYIERGLAFLGTNLQEAVANGNLPPSFVASRDPERLIPTFIKPEWIGIVVAGNPGMFWQRGYINNHEQGPPITRTVAAASPQRVTASATAGQGEAVAKPLDVPPGLL
jgi:hypothetical protein